METKPWTPGHQAATWQERLQDEAAADWVILTHGDWIMETKQRFGYGELERYLEAQQRDLERMQAGLPTAADVQRERQAKYQAEHAA